MIYGVRTLLAALALFSAIPAASADETCVDHALKSARVIPQLQGEQTVGMKILQIHAGSLWHKKGFRDRDIIIEADGAPVTSPVAAFQLVNSMCDGKGSVVVLRKRKRVTLKLR